MLYYPQLTTGSISQFPIRRETNLRTITNALADGSAIRMADGGSQKVRWQLRYSDLTDGERAALEALFVSAEGQLNSFTFLDPTENLLMWSEDWTQAVWAADPLLVVGGGVTDPFGGSAAMQLTNTGEAAQQVVQNTGGPSAFLYCFSVYLRSDVAATIQLVVSATGQTSLTAVNTGSAWTRAITTGRLAVIEDGVSFGVRLPAGVRIDAFGAQVEAQAAAGVYKKTTDRAGVYSNTRFLSDSFVAAATAPNQHACDVGLVSRLS